MNRPASRLRGALGALCLLLACSANAQNYPIIGGTYSMYEVYTISSIIGGKASILSYTNTFNVDILQTNETFVIVPANTQATADSRVGTLVGNSVTYMTGPAVPATPGWIFTTNQIAGVSGVVYSNEMDLSITGQASGMSPEFYPFTSTTTSKIQLFGTFHPLQPPTITTPPASHTNVVGDSVSFTVVATGATNFGYQWRKNGNLIAGATNSTFTLNPVQATDAGTYVVVVSNIAGSTNSTPAVLVVNSPPAITTQPVSIKQPIGTLARLSVRATGTPPLQYQWFLWTNAIPGATNSIYSFPALPVDGQTNLAYAVRVTNPYGSAMSSNAIVTVIHDRILPQPVTITSPAPNARLSNVVLSGIATDNGMVDGVSYWITNINNGSVVTGARLNATTYGTNLSRVSFTNTPSLLPGTNIVVVVSRDLDGNYSRPVTRQFFYRSLAPLTLAIEGTGSISGKSSVPGASEPVPAIGTANQLFIGQGYSLQASPASGWVFSSWTKSLGGVDQTLTNLTLGFIMEPGLAITANFVTNPFIALAGTYNGAFVAQSVAPESSGMLRGVKVDNKGAFTGQLMVNGTTYPLSGAFNIDGHVTKTIARPAQAGGPLALNLSIASLNDGASITGTVSTGPWNADVEARLASDAIPPSQRTVIIPPADAASSAGYGVLLITNKGPVATIAGRLADGTTVTISSTILDNGILPIYTGLYKGTGVLTGSISMTNSGTQYGLTWLKKASSGGFTNDTVVMVSQWTAPAPKTPALPFTAAHPATLHVAGGTLVNPLTFQIAVSSNNAIVKLPTSASTNSLKGMVDPKTGAFQITFGTTGKATAIGSGAMLQNILNGYGIFGSGTNYGVVTISDSNPL